MEYDELPELHYIAPIENVPSILEHGILSHARAEELEHASVALQPVQDRRAGKRVPGGRPLHEYVNLYFHARNPMMYLRQAEHQGLCVVSVRREILHLPDVVVTDGNAASDYTRFAAGADGLRIVDRGRVYATYWTDPDPIEQMRRKVARCAEVLVPDQVVPEYVRGAYLSCDEAEERLHALAPDLLLKQSPGLFFQ